jgi:hypothetical protein
MKPEKHSQDEILLRFRFQARQLTRSGTQGRVLEKHLLCPQQASFKLFLCHLRNWLPSLTADVVAMIAVEIAATVHF